MIGMKNLNLKDKSRGDRAHNRDRYSRSVSGAPQRQRSRSKAHCGPSSYRYLPLRQPDRQIRLLRIWILKGELHGELRVIDEKQLKRDYSYRALSYTWGNPERQPCPEEELQPEKDHRIWLKNTTHTKQTSSTLRSLDITKSLYDLLKRIVQPPQYGGKDWLWTDAICIQQQGDVKEKYHQLRKMKQIYNESKEVFAWLGLGNSATDEGMKFIAQRPHENKRGLVDDDLSNGRAYSARMDGFTTELRDHRFDLRAIFSRAYWTRMWILQELAVARNSAIIACGRHEIPWKAFVSFAMAADVPKEITQDLAFPRQVWLLNDMYRRHPQDLTLSRVIYLAQKSYCRNIADAVHAILGLVGSGRGTELRFRSDAKLQDIFSSVIITMIADLQDAVDSGASKSDYTLKRCKEKATKFEGKRPSDWDDEDFIRANCKDSRFALNLCREIARTCHRKEIMFQYKSPDGYYFDCTLNGTEPV